MAFPETNYPSNYDSSIDRTNNVDMVDEFDFDYHDKQIIRIQQFIGKLGKYIGQEIVGAGIAGALSHIASGGEAFRFAARSAFSAGTLFSLGHSFDTIYQEKLSVSYAGRIWAAGGLDIVDGSFLRIPTGSDLPVTFEAGRLFYRTVTDEGLKVSNGSTWNSISGTDTDAFHKSIAGEISALARKTSVVGTDKILIEDSEEDDEKKFIEIDDLNIGEGGSGAVSESYIALGLNYLYSQLDPSVAEIIGQQMFDGSKVSSAQTAKLRICWNPTMTTGTSYLRIYDIGPKEGPPTLPVLIKEFSTTTSGLQYNEQTLTISASGPALNTIKNNARIYEVTVFQDGTAEDTIYIGSVTLALEVTSLPTGTELDLFDVWAFGG